MSNMKTCACCGAEPFKLRDGGFGLVHKKWCSWQKPDKSEGQGSEASDPVTAPSHYAGSGIECKEAMRSMMGEDMANYWWGCAFKYVWRWPHKNGVQDIDKAIECLTELRKVVTE